MTTTHHSFDLSKAPCRIESITFAKAKPKDQNDQGAGVKKMTLWLNVATDGRFKKVIPLFPGVIDEHTPQRIANEQAAGSELRSKRKLGVAVVKVHNPEGEVLFESATARVERPKLVFGQEAKTIWLVLVIEMALPKVAIMALDDYFKADVLCSVGVAQLDIEDAAKDKAAEKEKANKEKAAARVQVDLIPKGTAEAAKAKKTTTRKKQSA